VVAFKRLTEVLPIKESVEVPHGPNNGQSLPLPNGIILFPWEQLSAGIEDSTFNPIMLLYVIGMRLNLGWRHLSVK